MSGVALKLYIHMFSFCLKRYSEIFCIMICIEVFVNHIWAKNIFHESYRVNKAQDYVLKIYKQVPNSSPLSLFLKHFCQQFPASSISFYWKDKTINHSNIYYVICCGARKAFHKIMQHKKIYLSCSVEACHFEELLP